MARSVVFNKRLAVLVNEYLGQAFAACVTVA